MKDKILSLLKKETDYLSGEKISVKLSVSRTSVWKCIKKLKEEGYEINSVTKRGYKLIKCPDVLTKAEIENVISTKEIGKNIFCSDVIDSTNNAAKRNNLFPHGSVFITEKQIAGKGRMGRYWESKGGEGIWMSILLKPQVLPGEVSKITLAAGLAVCDALQIFGFDAKIKWPNDVVLNGKKICGILTELSAEMDIVNYVVVGIGINVNVAEFPEELVKKATSLFIETGTKQNRAEITGRILECFETRYNEFLSGNLENFFKEYKNICITLGKSVKVIRTDCEFDAKAIDINEQGELVVEKANKKIVLNSGEVSVRGIYGYV